jgi:MSHA biogenesis protein MshJ
MNGLRQQWKVLGGRYAALSKRERLLVALGLVLGPLLIGNALFVDPQSARSKAMQNGIATESASLAPCRRRPSPAAGAQSIRMLQKAELATLVALVALDEQLPKVGGAGPARGNEWLLEGCCPQRRLRLISLKTQAPQSVLREKEAVKEADGKPVERSFDLYRHGVEIRLEGSYGQLQAYLAQLEKLPQRLLWGQLNYRVIDYPRAEMTLTVYTLSPDKTWLTL